MATANTVDWMAFLPPPPVSLPFKVFRCTSTNDQEITGHRKCEQVTKIVSLSLRFIEKCENCQQQDVIYRYWWIVVVVMREFNLSDVPCKDYTTWTLNLTLTLTLTHYLISSIWHPVAGYLHIPGSLWVESREHLRDSNGSWIKSRFDFAHHHSRRKTRNPTRIKCTTDDCLWIMITNIWICKYHTVTLNRTNTMQILYIRRWICRVET